MVTRPRWLAELGLPDEPALAEALVAFVERGRAALPGFAPDEATFARWVAARVSRDEPIPPQLEAMFAEDLCLACACVERIPAAVAAFEARHLSVLEPIVRSFKQLPVDPRDVAQALRLRLIVGSATEEPRLASYRGEGELGAWVRVVVTRHLINLASKEGRETPLDVFDSLTSVADGPELQLLRASAAEDIRLAFAEAIATLAPRQKNLLRYQYVDGLNAEEIARIYRVHRSTVMRWQSEVRNAVRLAMRDALSRRVKLSSGELDSFVRAALTGLEITLSRVLTKR